MIPLSLYVHIPWCVRKCPYCDFNSHESPAALPEQEYVDALLADFDADLIDVSNRSLQSIFIGGGTPSLFSAEAIERFLAGVAQRIDCDEQMEVTLEANPGTLEAGRYRGFREAGVNRLSIGVQSLDDTQLKRLGRIHCADEVIRAVASAREAGFDNFNLDLMYGLPEQSVNEALVDLRQALALSPTHLSWYQLTLEPNTVFHHRPPKQMPDDDLIWEIMQAGQALLAEAGYAQYEISAYALPGRQCRHNLSYWQFGDYIGIGAGAHGKLTLDNGSIVRRAKQRQPARYLNADVMRISSQQTISQDDLPVEFMLNVLRLNAGVPLEYFAQRTGMSLELVSHLRQEAVMRGLLLDDAGRWQPSDLGRRFLNDLLAIFEPE